MSEKLVCAWLSGEGTSQSEVEDVASRFRNCPYVYFIATKKKHLYATFFLAEERARGWVENQKKKPQVILGLKKAKVTLVENVHYPREMKLRLPPQPYDVNPCGLDCGKCPRYGKCLGCPASVSFLKR